MPNKFVKSATKKSILALVKQGALTARGWARLLEAVVFKSELDSFVGTASDEILASTKSDLGAYVRRDGTKALTADWDAGAFEIRAQTLESDVSTGTAPLTVSSTTKVANLNADLVDGKSETAFVLVDGSRELTSDWDAGAHEIRAETLESDVTTGTPPLVVASTTLVNNLNADTLDGVEEAALLPLTAGSGRALTGNLFIDKASVPSVLLRTGGAVNDYVAFFESDVNTGLLEKHTSASNAWLEISARPNSGTHSANVRVFRYTNTTGNRSFVILKGDNTPTAQHGFNAGTGDADLCQQSGQTTIGGTAGSEKLTVIGDGSFTQDVKATVLESTISTGTPPIIAASTTKVSNLNVDLLDDQTGSHYLDSDNFTGTEWTDLTDEGPTTLHTHGYKDSTVDQKTLFRSYIDVKTRNGVYSLHGGLDSLDTAHDLSGGDLVVTCGTGKIMLVINDGGDLVGDITITGTTVDRNTGAETGADTDTLTIDDTTTDNSSTDAEGNVIHEFIDAYLTSKWFKGSITISSADTAVTDMDTYQVSFDQLDDTAGVAMRTFDITAFATNSSAWLYAYLYTLHVTGDKCNIDTESTIDLPAAEVSADKTYRLRRGEIDEEFNGIHDGFWVEMFPGPLASTYWENINVQVWADITRTVTDGAPLPTDPENPLYGETPRYHHWNDETPGALPSFASGTLINGHDPPVVVTNNPGAPHGYNRSMRLDSSNFTDAIIDLGNYVSFGASGIRVALLIETYGTSNSYIRASVSDQSQQEADDGYNSLFFLIQENVAPDSYWHRRYINSVEDFNENYQPGDNRATGNVWRWVFFEQLEAGDTKWEVYDLDGTPNYSVTRAYQGGLDVLPASLRYLCVVGINVAPSYCAQIWVGTSDDDWPSLPMSPMTNL